MECGKEVDRAITYERRWWNDVSIVKEIEGRYIEFEYAEKAERVRLKERIKPEDVILMQFTGLTDKNGVEIYEGDVVEVQAWRTEKQGSELYEHRESSIPLRFV